MSQDNEKQFQRWLKLRQKVSLTQAAYDYYDMMIANIAPMIEYDELRAHGIEPDSMIEYAAAVGVAGVCKIGDEYRVGMLNWSDVIDDNGIAKKCVLSGSFWSQEFNTEDIAYFRFTHAQRPATHLRWFARQFANVDDSQRSMVRNTKYTPMPVVATEAERQKYEEAMRRQQDGEEITVIVNPHASPLFSDRSHQEENDRVLNIGDAAMIEKMHFLSEYHAELKKRFGSMYGMCFKSSSKSAQESLDEIHGMDNFSLIVPYNMREEMRLFADKCARLWNWADRSAVRFGELWRREDEQADTEAQREGEKENGTMADVQAGEIPSV